MSWPAGNEIVIDTNVFKHMCDRNKDFNADGHCRDLLGCLAAAKCVLLVDDAGVFYHEWDQFLVHQFKRESEIGNEVAILRYWAERQYHVQKVVSSTDELAKAIKKIIHENERADCAFVYLAFANGRILVTNDLDHIVRWPSKRKEKGGERRVRLKNSAKKYVVDGAEILLSSEAHACMGAN